MTAPTLTAMALGGNDQWPEIRNSIPAQGCTYWNGEALHGTDYLDLDEVPGPVADATAAAARNAAHLAGLLKEGGYPRYE